MSEDNRWHDFDEKNPWISRRKNKILPPSTRRKPLPTSPERKLEEGNLLAPKVAAAWQEFKPLETEQDDGVLDDDFPRTPKRQQRLVPPTPSPEDLERHWVPFLPLRKRGAALMTPSPSPRPSKFPPGQDPRLAWQDEANASRLVTPTPPSTKSRPAITSPETYVDDPLRLRLSFAQRPDDDCETQAATFVFTQTQLFSPTQLD